MTHGLPDKCPGCDGFGVVSRGAVYGTCEECRGFGEKPSGRCGADLRCDCGAGAVDVAPTLLLRPNASYQWHCSNGHTLISGCRPGFHGFQQMRFD